MKLLEYFPTRVLVFGALIAVGWLANDYVFGVIGPQSFKARMTAEIARLDVDLATVASRVETRTLTLIRIQDDLTALESWAAAARASIAVLKDREGL